MIYVATATFTEQRSVSDVLDIVVQVRVFNAVRKSQAIIVSEARSNCPVVSGDLQGSIEALEPVNTGREIVGTVVASSDHASFVEFGTGLRGAGTYPYPLPQEGVPITGSWIYDYKNQGWIGMESRPFLRPALDMARGNVLEEFRAA